MRQSYNFLVLSILHLKLFCTYSCGQERVVKLRGFIQDLNPNLVSLLASSTLTTGRGRYNVALS